MTDTAPTGRTYDIDGRQLIREREDQGTGQGVPRARPGTGGAIVDTTRDWRAERRDKEQDVMSDTLTYQQMGTAARGQAHAFRGVEALG